MDDFRTVFSLLEDLPKNPLPNAVGFIHEPDIARLYYRFTIYSPLTEEQVSNFVRECDFYLVGDLINLYQYCNGLRINQKFSIYGSLLNRGLQPITLDYGNLYERPIGLPACSTVIGALELSETNMGYLVALENGPVVCTSSFLKYDIIKSWPNISSLIQSEIKEALA